VWDEYVSKRKLYVRFKNEELESIKDEFFSFVETEYGLEPVYVRHFIGNSNHTIVPETEKKFITISKSELEDVFNLSDAILSMAFGDVKGDVIEARILRGR
jgi:hypothetical protein